MILSHPRQFLCHVLSTLGLLDDLLTNNMLVKHFNTTYAHLFTATSDPTLWPPDGTVDPVIHVAKPL